MAGSSKRVSRRVEVKTWHAEALRLRVAGHTEREIAAKVGKNVSTVHYAIEQEIREIPAPAVDDLRRVEGDRYDAIIKTFLPKAMRGSSDAARTVMTAIAGRARLFGLDAPALSEVKLEGHIESTAHDDVLSALAALAAKGAVGDGDPPTDT